ncbi:MAG: DUF1643 domain-containing protein [Candidatus Limnocylindria bacterium]
MLNPSTADDGADDPTIRRCMAFAREWGYGGLEVVNLFALRATDPRRLRRSRDPVGRENDAHIQAAAERAVAMVIAWGAHGPLRDRGSETLEILSPRAQLLALGWTRAGEPRHPLYLRRDVQPIVVADGRRSAA